MVGHIAMNVRPIVSLNENIKTMLWGVGGCSLFSMMLHTSCSGITKITNIIDLILWKRNKRNVCDLTNFLSFFAVSNNWANVTIVDSYREKSTNYKCIVDSCQNEMITLVENWDVNLHLNPFKLTKKNKYIYIDDSFQISLICLSVPSICRTYPVPVT